jgi:glycosyltransferase involved in cell wall biosynthesis
MKVAYLVSQYPAPSHTFVRREVQALRRSGIDVHTFSVRAPSTKERESVDHAECERTFFLLERRREMVQAHARHLTRRPLRYMRTLRDALRHRVPGARAALWSLFHFAEAISLADELERRGIDHLHNHFANSGANVGYLASRHTGLPFSLMLHGSSEFDYPAGPLLGRKIDHAEFVACASHYVRSQAMRSVHPDLWSKMFLVRCAVELERCPKHEPRPSGSIVRIVHVGRLAPEKGQMSLLEGFRAALDAGIDAELRIIGDGPMRAEVEARARALDLDDRCVFLGGMREDAVLAELAEADIFAMASYMEGLPVVLMEAMAVGVPVVAPSVAGIPELVEPMRTGLLFPTGDAAALGRALVRLCGDPELRERLAAAGRERVLAEFVMPMAVAPLIARLRVAEDARLGSATGLAEEELAAE